jgi:hypothetical protein
MKKYTLILLIVVFTWTPVLADSPKSAHEIGLMQGFLPTADKRVDKTNWLAAPFNRWAYQNISRMHNTHEVYRGDGPVSPFLRKTRDLDDMTYTDKKGSTKTFRQMLDLTYTDALVILHKGKIAYEKYFNGQTPHTRHIVFSATKSLVWVPTHTDSDLKGPEWGAGLTGVVTGEITPSLSFSGIVGNHWSFDGSFNTATIQPMFFYNIDRTGTTRR